MLWKTHLTPLAHFTESGVRGPQGGSTTDDHQGAETPFMDIQGWAASLSCCLLIFSKAAIILIFTDHNI